MCDFDFEYDCDHEYDSLYEDFEGEFYYEDEYGGCIVEFDDYSFNDISDYVDYDKDKDEYTFYFDRKDDEDNEDSIFSYFKDIIEQMYNSWNDQNTPEKIFDLIDFIQRIGGSPEDKIEENTDLLTDIAIENYEKSGEKDKADLLFFLHEFLFDLNHNDEDFIFFERLGKIFRDKLQNYSDEEIFQHQRNGHKDDGYIENKNFGGGGMRNPGGGGSG